MVTYDNLMCNNLLQINCKMKMDVCLGFNFVLNNVSLMYWQCPYMWSVAISYVYYLKNLPCQPFEKLAHSHEI